MIRQAIAAGRFYPADKTELEEEVRGFLTGKKKEIRLAIAPHAGYMFSGKLAGKVINMVPDNKKDFIMLGVNHSGLGNKISFSGLDFQTPLGIIKNNTGLADKIMRALKKEELYAGINEASHEYEHSLEVELPFLQLSQKKFKIVPILLRDLSYEECRKIAEVLAKIIDKNVFLLVSSDFTHYGHGYNFVPFKNGRNLDNYDKMIILEILKLNAGGFYHKASKSTICGLYSITIATELAKILGLKAELVDYYTSGDVAGDFSNCVGYAGIVFY